MILFFQLAFGELAVPVAIVLVTLIASAFGLGILCGLLLA